MTKFVREVTAMMNILGIRKAVRFIGLNFWRPLTLDEIADESGMSKYHFARTFKAVTGKTFKEYLTEKRVEKAKTLLADGEMTITEICYSVGFNDLSYFDRVFRKLVGINPLAYHNRYSQYRTGPVTNITLLSNPNDHVYTAESSIRSSHISSWIKQNIHNNEQ